MRTPLAQLLSVILILAAFGYSLWLYPRLPERVPLHWNAAGQIDGWGPRATAAFLTPAVMLAFWLLMLLLPALSPQRFKIEGFRHIWNVALVLLLLLFAYIHLLLLQAALQPRLDVSRLLMGGLGFFIALLGLLMPHVQPNFWMGVRTPWTLASPHVWRATHRFAARTMLIGGLLVIVLMLAHGPAILGLAILLLALLLPALHSLWLYKRLEGAGTLV